MSPSIAIALSGPGSNSHQIDLAFADSVSIGRDGNCDIVLPSSEVSRIHAEIHAVTEGIRIVDHSANGTAVGNQLLRASAVVVPDEVEIGVGPYLLRVRVDRRAARGSHAEADISPRFRRLVHRLLLDHLDLASIDRSDMGDEVVRPKVVDALERILENLAGNVPKQLDHRAFIEEVVDEALGLGPLQRLLDDDQISEIMVVDPETIYVESRGRLTLTNLRFTDVESCRAAIERIVTPLGRRIDESKPLVDARLPDGSRVNAVIPPLAIRGPCITIRKFPRHALDMNDLVSMGSLTAEMARFLERCVKAKKNLLVSGGTGSGKTTLLNVLSLAIPSDERIVTIEDAAELRLQQPHVVSLEAKPPNVEGSGGYSIRDLVKNALRMRPDRIVVGECRAGEAIDMLQAMNTGHEGSMTTTHANSAREALSRIQTLCMMAGLDLAPQAIREQVASSIDLVIQQARFSDGSRRVTAVTEVVGLDSERHLVLRDIFEFRHTSKTSTGDVIGEHALTGNLPSFLGDFIVQGLVQPGDGYL